MAVPPAGRLRSSKTPRMRPAFHTVQNTTFGGWDARFFSLGDARRAVVITSEIVVVFTLYLPFAEAQNPASEHPCTYNLHGLLQT